MKVSLLAILPQSMETCMSLWRKWITKLKTGNFVEECGFIVHPEHDWLGGASPDGLVLDNTVLEIKCPFGSICDKKGDDLV